MICYFQENLKLSIQVKIEQQDQASTSFEEIVQKAVNAEAKARLRLIIMIRDLDARYPRDQRLSHNTFFRVQTQGSNYKNSPHIDKFRPKKAKQASGKITTPFCSNKLVKPNYQKQKMKYQKKK